MVAEHEDRVVGFMIYELQKTPIHVLNFAVHTQFHHRGVGRQMLAKLIGKLSLQRRSRIVLEVRETNLAAQLFFRENGFAPFRCCTPTITTRPKRLSHAVPLPGGHGGPRPTPTIESGVWRAEKPVLHHAYGDGRARGLCFSG